MQRALWSGAISFGLVHIPVELLAAENRSALDLSMLDRRDFAPIGYKKFNKHTGEEVSREDIVKGYEYESGEYVVLSDEDLKRANVKATQTIDILGFVEASEVSLTYYDQPYYLTPGKGGDKVYALLRETLRRAGKIGIAQIVLRTKQHLVALLPMDDAIVLNTLRYGDEIRPINDLKLPDTDLKKSGISDKEIDMALSLVDGMSVSWDPSQYHDAYRNDVLAMIDQKVAAHQTKTITAPEHETPAAGSAKIVDLMALLKQSLAAKAPVKQTTADAKKVGTAAPTASAKVSHLPTSSKPAAKRSATAAAVPKTAAAKLPKSTAVASKRAASVAKSPSAAIAKNPPAPTLKRARA